jgi:putative flippase GtrA
MNSESGSRPALAQFSRFAVVGCLNVAVSFAVFLVFYRYWPVSSLLGDVDGTPQRHLAAFLSYFGASNVDAGIANAVGYLAGMVNSFLLNKRWTFEARGRASVQMRRFAILNVVGLVGSSAILFALVDVARAPYLPVWVATTAVVMIANFLGNKYWTFVDPVRPARRDAEASADGTL